MLTRRSTILLAAGGMVVVALTVSLVFNRGDSPARDPVLPADGLVGLANSLSEDEPAYPDDWRSNVDAVAANQAFEPILPDVSVANKSLATGYFIFPGGEAVAVTYPLPVEPASDVRQDYLEVWQAPRPVDDPEAEVQKVFDSSQIEGSSIVEIGGVSAIAVAAYSKSDEEARNPALVWFVVAGVEYHVSGGDSLDTLVSIASDIVERAT